MNKKEEEEKKTVTNDDTIHQSYAFIHYVFTFKIFRNWTEKQVHTYTLYSIYSLPHFIICFFFRYFHHRLLAVVWLWPYIDDKNCVLQQSLSKRNEKKKKNRSTVCNIRLAFCLKKKSFYFSFSHTQTRIHANTFSFACSLGLSFNLIFTRIHTIYRKCVWIF